MGMRCQALNRTAGVVLGAISQPRLSFVVVIGMARGLKRNMGVERKIGSDSHTNSWKNVRSTQIVPVWAM